MRKVISMLMSLVMFFTVAIPCFAATPDETVVSPRYTHISSNSVDLTINETTGIATCNATCYAPGTYTVEVECKLQRYQGGFWSTIKTWTSSGIRYASVYQNWAVYSGYTYRIYVVFYVRDSAGNLLESATSSASYNYPKK